MASVTIRNIEKSYAPQAGASSKDKKIAHILKGISLDIPDGALTVLVGPSGCGKSTLLRTVAGLEMPDKGQIMIGNDDVTYKEPRDRDIAMVFQSYALYPHLTVKENLAFGLSLRKTAKHEIEQRIQEVSKQLGLEPYLDRLPKALSGGQRQRVAMGRAIVRRPKVFLFDEPLSNLDTALRGQVRVEIRKLHDALSATMIYVTHDQVEAMTLADQLVVLQGGFVEQAGPPLEVYEHPATKFVAAFLGSPSMCFFDATLRIKDTLLTVHRDGIELPITRKKAGNKAKHGAPVTVGVRPHDVRRCGTDGLPFHVDIVESLGFESHVHGTFPGSIRFLARLEGRDALGIERGQTIHLSVLPEHVHLFDPETGGSLALR